MKQEGWVRVRAKIMARVRVGRVRVRVRVRGQRLQRPRRALARRVRARVELAVERGGEFRVMQCSNGVKGWRSLGLERAG